MSQKNPFGSSAIPEDEEEDYAGGTSTPETVISLAASEELENSLFVLYCVCVCETVFNSQAGHAAAGGPSWPGCQPVYVRMYVFV